MKISRALGTLAAGLLFLTACASGGNDRAYDVSNADMAVSESYSGSPMDLSGEDADEAGAPMEREVITSGSLTLIADDIDAANEEIIDLVEQEGGRIDARSRTAPTERDGGAARLTLRVPADGLTDTITKIEELGKVRDVRLASDDVTRYGQDLDARISALEASTERLIELMAEADTSEALIAAESALSERQADLESLRSERSYVSEQVAMSTLDVQILPTESAEFDSGGFVGGILSGWNALVNTASALLVAVGAALPWLLALGIPVAAVVWLLRRRSAKRRTSSEVRAENAENTADD